MLNEKKAMADKIFTFSAVAVTAGFLLGVGLILGLIGINGSPSFGIAGFAMIVGAVACGIIADRIQRELRAFINRPYLEEIEEEQ